MVIGIAGPAARSRAAAGNPEEQVGRMNNAFAVDLYARLTRENEKNVFFSPTSVQTALAMAWAGARGATARELATAMRFGNDPGGTKALAEFLRDLNGRGKQRGYELSVANALWGMKAYSFSPAYLHTVETDYGGHLAELDFENATEAARQTINAWVAAQTYDKIKELLESLDPGTRLVLTNALYFKSPWQLPFDKKATADADFMAANGQKATAPFMHQTAVFGYAEDDAVQMLELPYGEGDLAMRVFLPKSNDGLPSFEKALTARRLYDLADRSKPNQVSVSLPRFKVETRYQLERELPEMGIPLAFSPQADFSGMSSAEHFHIDEVIHKAFVRIDEEGTEAAAATAIVLLGSSGEAHYERKVFRADHPFMFVIVHRPSGAMLFMGRVENP